ncbi:uncharacterized protein TRAVEDRAFT_27432 [Trametes versicolor FP-101664 SS1]|uniref:uncharacterized protein n=1 Tax=Trametes versicolor (strain FP-101664) TaxID=717944 RepID=UPI00046224FA|nr:uncharacterized protein TRAVEDRAFT_27432 [Trametes versicolor FP-101664 SS1]EIW62027.1 hypothetical protein TRAVEDRAFT_27432 [Trametes versicolor FP-101664 SS1]
MRPCPTSRTNYEARLARPPPPSRTPTAPAEMFTAALLDGDILGLDALQGMGPIENVAIDLSIEERLGKVEGCFQDPSTWTLVLSLKPDMFMTPLKLTLAEFVGDLGQVDTPTWLLRLEDRAGRFAKRVRSYKWLETYAFNLLTTPYLKLPMVKSWGRLLAYVWRIKDVCEPRARRPRDPSRPLPRPRRVRSANQLVDAMLALSLNGAGSDTMTESNGAGYMSA